jgi:pyruvate dehydrogenase E1 component alpha subunit
MFDPELYREKAEVEAWKQRDPIPRLAAELRAGGALDDTGWSQLESEVERELAGAVGFAERGTWERVEELLRFVTSERPAR